MIMIGRIHSFQSLGTVDGPGVRAVLFMQGCPLRCICCHNPDTWDVRAGRDISVDEAFDKIYRLRSYFGKDGGVTVSGGEPLLQADFVSALFEKCKDAGINTALDTSGCVYNQKVDRLIDLCDLILLDYKYTDGSAYLKNVGMKKEQADAFLDVLEAKKKSVWIRQVIIPGINSDPESVKKLSALREIYACIEKIELLPFRKLCIEKYQVLGIEFPLLNTPAADEELMKSLNNNL